MYMLNEIGPVRALKVIGCGILIYIGISVVVTSEPPPHTERYRGARPFLNVGIGYLGEGNLYKAEYYLLTAAGWEGGRFKDKYQAYISLSKLYTLKGDTEKATFYDKKAFDLQLANDSLLRDVIEKGKR